MWVPAASGRLCLRHGVPAVMWCRAFRGRCCRVPACAPPRTPARAALVGCPSPVGMRALQARARRPPPSALLLTTPPTPPRCRPAAAGAGAVLLPALPLCLPAARQGGRQEGGCQGGRRSAPPRGAALGRCAGQTAAGPCATPAHTCQPCGLPGWRSLWSSRWWIPSLAPPNPARAPRPQLPTAVLSTTARAKARAARKAKEAAAAGGQPDAAAAAAPGGDAMDTDAKQEGGEAGGAEGGKEGAEAAAAAAKPREPEPASFTGALLCGLAGLGCASRHGTRRCRRGRVRCARSCHALISLPLTSPPRSPASSLPSVDNPARVVPGQRRYISFPEGQRFAPIRPSPAGAPRRAGCLAYVGGGPRPVAAAAAAGGGRRPLACVRPTAAPSPDPNPGPSTHPPTATRQALCC